MRKSIILASLLALGACSTAQVQTALSSPAGQLFCAIQTSGGGTVVVGLVDEVRYVGARRPGRSRWRRLPLAEQGH